MLRPNVKEYADSGNVRGLHYIFRDALDADPTFENWLDSYDYCEKVPGFFVEHTELTPFDNSRWKDETYWVQLKMDLMENFSKERYEYLRQMAQVYYAEKIKRIQLERAQRSRNNQDAGTSAAPGQNAVRPQPTAARENAAPAEQEARKQTPKKDLNAAENERIRQMREEIEEANRKAAEAKRNKERALEQARQELAQENRANRNGGNGSKKLLGVVLAAVVIILAIVFLLRGSPNTAAAAITAQKASQEVLANLPGEL